MGISRKRCWNHLKVFAASFIIFLALGVDYVLVHQLEVQKREQAVYNVQHTVECLTRIEEKYGTIDYGDMKICADGMRTSETGDMYILNLETTEFLYDGSKDVPNNRTMYFTKDSIGEYFVDWDSAEDAIGHMVSGIDSTVASKVGYNFDGVEEWLEYKLHITEDGRKMVVVQGAQSDEVLNGYTFVRTLAKTMAGVYAMWLLSTAPYRKRETDDCSS